MVMSDAQQTHPREDVTAERITILLFRTRRSVSALAREAAIDRPSLSAKMHGHRRWYLDEIQSIARILDTSVSYLLGETDDARPLTQKVPASFETGTFVAGTGFEPVTSGL